VRAVRVDPVEAEAAAVLESPRSSARRAVSGGVDLGVNFRRLDPMHAADSGRRALAVPALLRQA
jgi:hypothetical protein